jgi:hypothetical protein
LSSFSRTTSTDGGVRKSQSEQNFCRNFQKEKGKDEKAANVIGKSFSEQFLLDTNTKYKKKKRQVKEDDEEEEEERGDGKQLLQNLKRKRFRQKLVFHAQISLVKGSKHLWCFSLSVSLEVFLVQLAPSSVLPFLIVFMNGY